MFGSKRLLFARNRRFWVSSGGVALCVAVLLGGCHLWKTRNWRDAGGVYLVGGGRGYIEIEALAGGRLKVNCGFLETEFWKYFAFSERPEVRLSASMSGDSLTIKQSFDIYLFWEMIGILDSKYVLRPSEDVVGDWDLVDARVGLTTRLGPQVRDSDYWKNLLTSSSISDFLGRLMGKDTFSDLRLLPTAAPMPSFLHRVDDARIVDYMSARLERASNEEDLKHIREISDGSDDPYFALHRIELEAQFGDLALAEQKMSQWESENHNSPDLILLASKELVKDIIHREKFLLDHQGLSFVEDMFPETGRKKAGKELREWQGRVLDSGELLPSRFSGGLVVGDAAADSWNYSGNIWADVQGFAKVIRTESLFDLFRGERNRSIRSLAGGYRIGQSLMASGPLIQRLVGCSFSRIVSEGFEQVILNACESQEDCDKIWTALEQLGSVVGLEDGTTLFSGERLQTGFMANMKEVDASRAYDPDEASIWFRVALVEFQLLRMAASTRSCQVREGRFPDSRKDFYVDFSDGLPSDPFQTSGTLRFYQRGDNLYVYSVGPDGRDDSATVEFDSQNGIKSVGDILIRIPLKREYPFLRDGVYADDAADLLRQFPKGLPLDVFGYPTSEREFSLSILDSTTTQPLSVFSYGPDINTDLRDSLLWADASSTSSLLSGRCLRIYRAEPNSSPSLRDARELAKEMLSESEQYLADSLFHEEDNGTDPYGLPYIPDPETTEPDPKAIEPGQGRASGHLGPYYDSSNGTNSAGDLFISIPRRSE